MQGSNAFVRTLPLPDDMMAYPKKAVSGLPKNAYVLTGKTDKPMELRTYQYYFEPILRRCGIRKRSYHTLRHSLKRELQYPARVLKFSYKKLVCIIVCVIPTRECFVWADHLAESAVYRTFHVSIRCSWIAAVISGSSSRVQVCEIRSIQSKVPLSIWSTVYRHSLIGRLL